MQNLGKIFLFSTFTFCATCFGYCQNKNAIVKLVEYCPAPGQFVNTSIGGPSAAAVFNTSEQGFLTLGGFGGYIVFRLVQPIENDSQNPYGIDFSIFGNASASSSEPAAVWVMTDSNQNQQPDETWLLLAGSDYWFSTSKHHYQVTYYNPAGNEAANIPWSDNEGATGYIFANEFHSQPYYPLADSFPMINQNQYSLSGEQIRQRIDTTNPMLIVTQHYPFGYADNTPKNLQNNTNSPDNPYSKAIEGMGGDSFDLSWAIDAQGNYRNPEKVDFIKIQNVLNFNYGRIGELSTEISGIVDIQPDAKLLSDSVLIALQPLEGSLSVSESVKCEAFCFLRGQLQPKSNFKWSVVPDTYASIDNDGRLVALHEGKITVFASLVADEQIYDSIQVEIISAVNVQESPGPEMVLFPNPTHNKLKLQGFNTTIQVVIFNATGHPIKKVTCENGFIDVSSLTDGIYFISLIDTQRVQSIKFIKN